MLPAWPGPEEPDTPDAASDGHAVEGVARTWWDAEAESYQDEHGAFLSPGRGPAGAGFVWGPEGRTEEELGVLGPVEALRGRRILEVGAGAAQCSAWLADRGADAVALDISLNQLRRAPRRVPDRSPDFGMRAGCMGLIAGTATALPFAGDSFDLAFCAYGAVQFVADLDQLVAEVARVLRPGGRWCFSVTHPIRWAFPDDPDQVGLGVSGSYFDRTPYVERDAKGAATYAEFHRTTGDYVAALVRAGFVVDSLIEPEWPDWNDATWGGWSPLRGWYLPGTLILGAALRTGRVGNRGIVGQSGAVSHS